MNNDTLYNALDLDLDLYINSLFEENSGDKPELDSNDDEVTREEELAKPSDRWQDLLRKGAAITDIGATGLSLIPGIGNLVGGLGGLGATVMHGIADAFDPAVTKKELIKNLAVMGGLSAINFIPGAAAAKLAAKGATKAAKIANTTGKVVKVGTHAGLLGMGATHSIAGWDRFKYLNNKRKNKEPLSVEENRELTNYISILASTISGSKATAGKLAPIAGNNFIGKTLYTMSDPVRGFAAIFNNKAALFRHATLAPYINSNGGTSYKLKLSDGSVRDIDSDVAKQITSAFNKKRSGETANLDMHNEINDIFRKSVVDIPKQSLNDLNKILNGEITDNFEINLKLDGDNITQVLDLDLLAKLKGLNEIERLTELRKLVIPEEVIIDTRFMRKVNPVSEYTSLGDIDWNNPDNLLKFEFSNKRLSNSRINSGYSLFRDPIKKSVLKNIKDRFGLSALQYTDKELYQFFLNTAQENKGLEDILILDKFIQKLDNIDLGEFKKSMNVARESLKKPYNGNRNNTKLSDTQTSLNSNNTTEVSLNSNNEIVVLVGVPITEKLRLELDLSKLQSELLRIKGTPNSRQRRNDLEDLIRSLEILLNGFKRLGGTLLTLKALRGNFTTDTSDKFSKGGILKASNGEQLNDPNDDDFEDVPAYYTKYYPYVSLKGFTVDLDNSKTNTNVRQSRYFGKANNLNAAYALNEEYKKSGKVIADVLAFLAKKNYQTPEEAVSDYNSEVSKIDSRWKTEKSVGLSGASEGNVAYHNLYPSSSLPKQDNLINTYGSLSHNRRGLKYEKSLKDLTEDELASRTIVYDSPNGSKWTFYLKEDGTLTTNINADNVEAGKMSIQSVLTDEGNTLKLNTRSSATNSGSSNGSKNDEESYTGIKTGDDDKVKLDSSYWGDSLDSYLIGINKVYPELLDLARYLDNKRNNQKVYEVGLLKRAIHKSPIYLKTNVNGNFNLLTNAQRLQNEMMSAADKYASLTNNPEAGSAVLLDSQMRSNTNMANAYDKYDAGVQQSAKESQALEKENYMYNKQVGDSNAAADTTLYNFRKDLKASMLSALTTNNSNFSMGKEKRARDIWDKTTSLTKELNLLRLDNLYKRLVTETEEIKGLRALIIANPTADNTAIQRLIDVLIAKNLAKYGKFFFESLLSILLGKPLSAVPQLEAERSSIKIPFLIPGNKKGGKLTNHKIKRDAEDLRELRKQIRFNITSNQKALDNLSKATLLELKKMMDI